MHIVPISSFAREPVAQPTQGLLDAFSKQGIKPVSLPSLDEVVFAHLTGLPFQTWAATPGPRDAGAGAQGWLRGTDGSLMHVIHGESEDRTRVWDRFGIPLIDARCTVLRIRKAA